MTNRPKDEADSDSDLPPIEWEEDGGDVIVVLRGDGTSFVVTLTAEDSRLLVDLNLTDEERRWLVGMIRHYGVDAMLMQLRSGGLRDVIEYARNF
jgi:hypothetical protein